MTKISLPEKPDLTLVLRKISKAPEGEAELLLPPEPQFWSVLSLKVLKRQAEYWGKEVKFVAQDEAGEKLLRFLRGEEVESSAEVPPALGIFAKMEAVFRGLKGWRLRTPLILGVVVVLILCVVIFGLFFFSRATVRLTLNTNSLVKTVGVILDPSLEAMDAEKMALPAIAVSVEEHGSFEGDATGRKSVGEKAQGKIIAYNYDTHSSKVFPKGSQLVTDEGLQFVLDAEIKLNEASESADPDNPSLRVTEPDEVEVKVTAGKIGSSYNIKKGTKLDFSDLDESYRSDVFAKAKEDFSGGSSREVKVVTSEDQNRLLSDSLRKLSSECVSGLSGKLVEDQKLAEKATEVAELEKTFSPALGEESDKVHLELRVGCRGFAYSEKQLEQLLSQTLTALVPEGFTLSSGGPEITILAVEKRKDGEGYLLQTKIVGKVSSRVDEQKIKEVLAGSTFSQAQTYLATLPDINSYRVSFWPPLPQILGRFPFRADRIRIVVDEN